MRTRPTTRAARRAEAEPVQHPGRRGPRGGLHHLSPVHGDQHALRSHVRCEQSDPLDLLCGGLRASGAGAHGQTLDLVDRQRSGIVADLGWHLRLPCYFVPSEQTTFGWFENDVYIGLLMLAEYLCIQRLCNVTLTPGR
jgi:hypothetical protein